MQKAPVEENDPIISENSDLSESDNGNVFSPEPPSLLATSPDSDVGGMNPQLPLEDVRSFSNLMLPPTCRRVENLYKIS